MSLRLYRWEEKPNALEEFARLIFFREESQRCFVDMVNFVLRKRECYLRDIIREFMKRSKDDDGSYYPVVINRVWKTCLRLGLFERSNRRSKVKISPKFSKRLRTIAEVWDKVVDEAEWRRRQRW